MRWLVVRTLILLIVCLFVTGTAVVVGRQQPISPRLAMLHLTDCKLPCWIGIIPGTTTLDEAKKDITATYSPSRDVRIDDTQPEYGWVYIDIGDQDGFGEDYVHVVLSVDRERPYTVQAINFYNFELPTVAELYSLLDAPSRLGFPEIAGYEAFLLSYGTDQYQIMVGIPSTLTDRMDWSYPANRLFISASPFRPVNICAREQLQPWKGFRSQQSYYAAVPEC